MSAIQQGLILLFLYKPNRQPHSYLIIYLAIYFRVSVNLNGFRLIIRKWLRKGKKNIKKREKLVKYKEKRAELRCNVNLHLRQWITDNLILWNINLPIQQRMLRNFLPDEEASLVWRNSNIALDKKKIIFQFLEYQFCYRAENVQKFLRDEEETWIWRNGHISLDARTRILRFHEISIFLYRWDCGQLAHRWEHTRMKKKLHFVTYKEKSAQILWNINLPI